MIREETWCAEKLDALDTEASLHGKLQAVDSPPGAGVLLLLNAPNDAKGATRETDMTRSILD
jgi:hypothetical protein